MKILEFNAVAMNGYQDITIPFSENEDNLSFITGINGSGKTSCLNSIIALLMPRLERLSEQDFQKITLKFEHEKIVKELTAEKEDEEITLKLSDEEQSLSVDQDLRRHYSHEERHEHEYIHYSRIYRDNRVWQYICNLPTPMYLNLDRKIASVDEERRHITRDRDPRRRQNILSNGGSLQGRLHEAIRLTEREYQKNLTEKIAFNEEFQKKIMLDLIDFNPIKFKDILRTPDSDEIQNLTTSKENLRDLPRLLNMTKEEQKGIDNKFNKFFEFMDNNVNRFLKPKSDTQSNKQEENSDKKSAELEWSFNKSHIDKISNLSEKITAHNKKIKIQEEGIEKFLNSINSFFIESGKEVAFNKQGRLEFVLNHDTSEKDRPLKTLSSGEIQIFVILAYLHFNPEAQKAGIFVIDEPELSLHVQWQEKFVAEIVRAAPDLQYILATHAPSIILGRTDFCIDISRK
jgi:predicted ATPase